MVAKANAEGQGRAVVLSLGSFITNARAENVILERNGATSAAQARTRLLDELEEAIAAHQQETLPVERAAQLAGVSEETVRRAVRNREIEDIRTNPRGSMKIKVGDVAYLSGKRRRKSATPGYDPVAHAEELARR